MVMGNKPVAVAAPPKAWYEEHVSEWKWSVVALVALVILFALQSWLRPKTKQERALAKTMERYQTLRGVEIRVEVGKAREFLRELRGLNVHVGSGKEPVLVTLYVNEASELTYKIPGHETGPPPSERYLISNITSARLVIDKKDDIPRLLVDFNGSLVSIMSTNQDDPLPQLKSLAEGFGSLVLAAGSTETPLSGLLVEEAALAAAESRSADGNDGSPLKVIEAIQWGANTYVAQPLLSLGGLLSVPTADEHAKHD